MEVLIFSIYLSSHHLSLSLTTNTLFITFSHFSLHLTTSHLWPPLPPPSLPLLLSLPQTWTGNMGKSGKTIIKESKSDYTKVTFKPDLSKFGMTHLTKDMVDIMTRRVYDMAGVAKGVAVYLNGKRLPVSGSM